MEVKKNTIILVSILLLSSLLRIWQLDKAPVGLFGDEVDVGYQAYSILHTGKDYMGQFLPFYIHSLAEWRAPLFIYTAVPTIAIFGLNEWGVRLSAAIFGIFGVYLLYILVRKLRGERLALLSAFILSVLPWHIHYSRAAFEVTLLLDLLLLGTILILDFKNKYKIIAAAVLFALTPYTYSTAVVFTPLYILLFLFFLKKNFAQRQVKYFLAVFMLVLVPFAYLTFFGTAAGRFSLLSVFKNDRILDEINIERSETNFTSERLFHNKIVGWAEVVASNYARSFSPEFLFVKGDPNARQAVPFTGEFYWVFLLFLLVGFYKLVKEKEEKFLIVGWLFLAPIASSLTIDGANHATRLFLMVVPLVIITALGAEFLLAQKAKGARLIVYTSIVLLVGNVVFYQHRYFTHYGIQQWKYWQYGYKDAMKTVGVLQGNYDMVFINNTYEPSLLHYLFWTKYDPVLFQQQFTGDRGVDNIYPGFNGFKLGEKLYFGETKNLGSILTAGALYMAAQGKEIPGDWDWSKTSPKDVRVLNVVHTPQGSPLFTIVSKK